MSDAVGGLVDHLFRRTAARIIARLTSVLGSSQLWLAEEVVQDAMVTALQHWSIHGIPDDPAAWLFRVAKNRAIDQLRRADNLRDKEPQLVAAFNAFDGDGASATRFAHEIDDDELRMMLMCCHPSIGEESRIALTLSTVCGFSVDEIARAFLTKKEALAQRLARAKRLIRDQRIEMTMPPRDELPERRDSLLAILYLLFNEGYSAHEGDDLVRRELCEEAIRLTRAVAAHPVVASPSAHALLALMLMQAARLPARVDASGELVVLAEQDRAQWDGAMIADGLRWLDRSATGDVVSRYHVEAAIASCHAVAHSFEETDWQRVIELYDELLAMNPSPVIALNRAVAVAIAGGPAGAVQGLEQLAESASLRNYLPLVTTLGELSLRAGNRARAAEHFSRALELPSTTPEKRFLLRKLEQCRTSGV